MSWIGPTAVRASRLRSQAGKKLSDSACVAAKRSVDALPSAMARASSGRRAVRSRTCCAVPRSHWPASVSVTG